MFNALFRYVGLYTFKLHARKTTYSLSARSLDDANDWVLALQDAIDSTPTVQTITERLVLEIIVSQHTFWSMNSVLYMLYYTLYTQNFEL